MQISDKDIKEIVTKVGSMNTTLQVMHEKIDTIENYLGEHKTLLAKHSECITQLQIKSEGLNIKTGGLFIVGALLGSVVTNIIINAFM